MSNNLNTEIHPRYSRAFFNDSMQMILNFLEKTLKGQYKVIDLKLPQQLLKTIDIQIGDEAVSEPQLIKKCQTILENQPKPFHPHFHNQLFGGFDQYSTMGAMMTAAINGSMYTYQMAPCFTLMEAQVSQHIKRVLEWDNIDGIMTPGGSMANFYAIQLAKHHKFPETKLKGIYGLKPMKIFTSDVSHYSFTKGAFFCGIGVENVVKVATDDAGRMIPEELQKEINKCIQQGNTPLMVNATVGTTVEGSIDPVEAIGDLCQKYKIWYHVDGALGGSLMLSQKYRKLIGNCKKADSMTWNPHKGLVIPLQAAWFFCRHANLMLESNSSNADYLFPKQRLSYEGSLDTGDKSLQCGRAVDILKLWVYLKGHGWKNVGCHVDSEHESALWAAQYIKNNAEKFLLSTRVVETFNVCFWSIPKNLKREDFESEDDYFSMISKVTVLAKKYMIQQGKTMIAYQRSKGKYYHWRLVCSDPFCTKDQLKEDIQYTYHYCQRAYQELRKQ